MDDLVIVYRVTERCNLACHFCGYSNLIARSRADANPDHAIRFGELLREHKKITGRAILVSWIGGEPFLWKPLFDLTTQFKTEFDLRVSVTTNGTTLQSDAIRKRVVADFDEITISVDGVGADHDGVRDRAGLFDELRTIIVDLARLKTQATSNLLIRVNTILMRDNVRQFETLCNELADWGVAEITFNPLGGRDRPEFFPAHRLTPDDVTWFRAQLSQIRQRGLNVRGGSPYLDRIATRARDQSCAVRDCTPGAHFWFVDEQGTIAPCHFTTRGYGVPIDQLRDASDLQRLPIIFSARQQRDQLAPCRDCVSTHRFAKFDPGI